MFNLKKSSAKMFRNLTIQKLEKHSSSHWISNSEERSISEKVFNLVNKKTFHFLQRAADSDKVLVTFY